MLTQLNAHEIDLLVLDLGMPGITGSRWIRALRDAHPDLHIIVMTANQDSHARRGLAAGVEAYLLKQGRNADAAGRGQRAGAQACNARGAARRVRRAACLARRAGESLTRREQQILALIAAGATGTEWRDACTSARSRCASIART